jgi:hypothetical protein
LASEVLDRPQLQVGLCREQGIVFTRCCADQHVLRRRKSPGRCRGFEFRETCWKSVLRDHRTHRTEVVIDLEQHFVGGQVLVTGDVCIAATSPSGETDRGDRAQVEILAIVLRIAIFTTDVPARGEGIGDAGTDGKPVERLGVRSRPLVRGIAPVFGTP